MVLSALLTNYSTYLMLAYLVYAFYQPEILSESPLSRALPYFKLAIVLFLLKKWFWDQPRPEKNVTMRVDEQNEFRTKGNLLDAEGRLIEAGWSRKPIKHFSPEKIGGLFFGFKSLNALRIKKFEYYSFLAGPKLVQIIPANIGYGASLFVNVFDFETKRAEKFGDKMLPMLESKHFPRLAGNPFECQTASYEFKKGDFHLQVHQSEDKQIKAHKTTFDLRISNIIAAQLTCERDLTQDDHFEAYQSDDNPQYFYYNLKSYDNRWTGVFTYRGNQTQFGPRQGIGACDYGRGVLPYKTSWIWGSAFGKLRDGRVFGLNLGGGIGVESRSVEDYFKLDGKIHKLNPITIPYRPGDKVDTVPLNTNPDLKAETSVAQIDFKPLGFNEVSENLLVIVSSIKYVYGTFSGYVIDEKNHKTSFEEILGMIEWGQFKW
jgi:hypothetical protein